MDNLPVELIDHILSFLACTDDGKTYRSLSRTCSSFREIVYPYQWTNLVFRSMAKLSQFIALVKEERSTKGSRPPRRPVENIFIVIDYNSVDFGEEGKGAEELFRTLFALSSQSLVSLACFHHEPFSMLEFVVVRALANAISAFTFPKLHDLTASALIFHIIPSIIRDEGAVMDVRRIHIYDWQPAFSRRLFQLLIAKFPYATHLRITGHLARPLLFWLMLHNDLDVMWKLMEKKSPGLLEDAKRDVIPGTLRQVVYQHDEPIPNIAEIQQRFDGLFSAYCRNPCLFRILTPGRYGFEEMFRDWLGCVGGNDESWGV